MNRQEKCLQHNNVLSNKWRVLHNNNRDIKRETATAAVHKKIC